MVWDARWWGGVCLLWAASAVAQPQRLAVLELHDEAELGPSVAGFLTDAVRGVAAGTLGAGWFVFSRENLMTALPPGTDLAQCDGACEVDVGRQIGADQVVSGSVLRIDGVLKVSLQLHSTADGRLVGRESGRAERAGELEAATQGAAGRLLARLAPSGLPGVLQIRGVRGLEVFIDGVEVGKTPLADRKLPAGTHRLRAVSACTVPVELTLVIAAGERRVVDLSPDRQTVAVRVEALDGAGAPVAAQLFVDGDRFGPAPGPLAVPVCSREIVAVADGGAARWSQRLELKADQPVSLTAMLGQAAREPKRVKRAESGLGSAGAGWLVVSGITGLVLGAGFAAKNAEDGEALKGSPGNRALRDEVDASYRASMGFYLGGAIALSAGVVWWVFSGDEDEDGVGLQVGPGGAVVRGRF